MNDTEFKLAALKVGLKRLFSKGHFSICLFKELCELANIIPPDDTVKALEPLHCLDYDQMDKAFRNELQRRVFAVFSAENAGFDLMALEEKPVATVIPTGMNGAENYKERLSRLLEWVRIK